MEKYCVYYDSAVDDIEYEPRSYGSWYRVEDVEPILNSIQQLKADILRLKKEFIFCEPNPDYKRTYNQAIDDAVAKLSAV